MNAGWPGVAIATGAFLHAHQSNVTAVAVGRNKLYICRLRAAAIYTKFFRNFCARSPPCKFKAATAGALAEHDMVILGPKSQMSPKFT